MKVIKSNRGIRKIKGAVLALGNFDGIHLGHQKIIGKVMDRARATGGSSVVYTFDPHPMKVVAPHKPTPLIMTLCEKEHVLEDLGLDYLVLAEFDKEFAAKDPRAFIEEVLVDSLNVKEVWVGHDYSFGRGKAGKVEFLRDLGREFGFSVNVVPPYKRGGEIVSSSRIRGLISKGDVKGASKLLGRNLIIRGYVVHGKSLGKGIGFPTANINVISEVMPKMGIYAVYAVLKGISYPGVINIGTAPTFGGTSVTFEVHIFDFDHNIYNRKIDIELVERLRSERTFGSVDDLVEQIKDDCRRARKILKRPMVTNGK